MLIYSKLHSKSCDYLYKITNPTRKDCWSLFKKKRKLTRCHFTLQFQLKRLSLMFYCGRNEILRSVKYGSPAQDKTTIQEVWSVWPLQSRLIASTTNHFFCSVYLIFPRRYASQWTNYRKSECFLLWQQHGQMWCWSCNIFFYCISRSASNQTEEFNWWEYRSRFSYVDLLRPFSSKSNRQMNVLRTVSRVTLVYSPKISGL